MKYKKGQVISVHPVPRHWGLNVESIRCAGISVAGTSSSSYFGLGDFGIMRSLSN